MPYKTLDDLPKNVKVLPKHGQEIFMAAFNNAEKEYKDESRQYATAWAAVEHKYHKNEEGKWVKNKEE